MVKFVLNSAIIVRSMFLVFFIFLAWLVPPCCGVGVSNAPYF
ncbi:putative membrane protein [Helicobacter pylori Hp A-20]|nr:putative membrane protein [Helicobacter pylori Hp A-20]